MPAKGWKRPDGYVPQWRVEAHAAALRMDAKRDQHAGREPVFSASERKTSGVVIGYCAVLGCDFF